MGIKVAALLTAEIEGLSLKRGPEGFFLKHEAAALRVLDHGHTLLPFSLFPPSVRRGRGQKEAPHA